jgi:hypothetical protein
MMDATKAKDTSDETGSKDITGAAAAPAPVSSQASATEQAAEQPAIDPAFAPLGSFTATYFTRRIKAHRHPTIKLDLREVEVLEVMPDARLKVMSANATDNEEHFYINLDATSFDMLLSKLFTN